MKKILIGMLLSLIITTGTSRAETSRDVFLGKWNVAGGTINGKKIEIEEQDSGYLEFRSDNTATLFLKNGKKGKAEEYSWEIENSGLLFTDKNGGKEYFEIKLSENNTVVVFTWNHGTILNLKRAAAEEMIIKISREQFIGSWNMVKVIENDDTSPLREDENKIFEFISDGSVRVEMKKLDKVMSGEARWYFNTNGTLTIKTKDGEEVHFGAGFSENGNILTLGQKGKFGVFEKILSSKSSTSDVYKDDIKEK